MLWEENLAAWAAWQFFAELRRAAVPASLSEWHSYAAMHDLAPALLARKLAAVEAVFSRELARRLELAKKRQELEALKNHG